MPTLATPDMQTLTSPTHVMLARQPVYNQNLGIYAYEFLFRSRDTTIDQIDAKDATGEVLSNFIFHFNLEDMMCGRKAILNTPVEFIPTLLNMPIPAEKIILDIPDDTAITASFINQCKQMNDAGFEISIGGIQYLDDIIKHASLFDIYRVDTNILEKDTYLTLPEKFKKSKKIKLLATMVETLPEYLQATHAGYELAQGYFLSKPREYIEKTLPDNKIATLNLLATVFSDDANINELDKIITEDVSLSFKLLKLINSPFFALETEVDSIRQALVLLGAKEIRNFAAIISLKNCGDQPLALVEVAMLRAKLCESLAEAANLTPNGFFMAGMFSALDLLMEAPLNQILGQLPFSDEIKLAILKQQGEIGDAIKCAKAIEQSEWSAMMFKNLEDVKILTAYHRAVLWTNDLLQNM